MRRYYTLLFTFLLAFSMSFGQNQVDLRNVSAPMPTKSYTGLEEMPLNYYQMSNQVATKPTTFCKKDGGICETVIGTSTYDLQSNAAVQNRLVMTANGMSALWTFSDENSTSWTDRGTGHNYQDGTNWGSFPTERLETVRVGWPSVGVTGGGREFAISHPGFTNIQMTYRDGQGSGAWSELLIPTNVDPGLLWPRATTGGADNNSIHMVCVSTPVANGGVEYEGLDGALLYYRSQDQGDTWDIIDLQIPEIENENFIGFDGDTYSIAANGNTVAIGVFGDFHDTFVLISEDNGTTWAKTTMVDFPIDAYVVDTGIDIDMDGIADTLDNSDGSGNVIVDYNGNVHCWYGNMRYLDADLGDGNFSFFPFTSGVWYWNQSFQQPQQIVGEIDTDGDPDILGYDDLGAYFVSVTGLVNGSQDLAGNLHLAFSSLREDVSNGLQNYRHIYITSSSDNGQTWTEPYDVTPELDGDETIECVFPSMAPLVDDRIQLVFQRDFEPGLAVRGDMDPVDLNEIVHMDIAFPIVGLQEQPTLATDIQVFPNPSNGLMTINSDFSTIDHLNINVIDLMGKSVFKDQILRANYTLDLNQLSAGAYYIIFENGGLQKAEKIIIE
ncbi:MAG: T9SS type A sorting domain-containing protein [Bacteroidota bacterium]